MEKKMCPALLPHTNMPFHSSVLWKTITVDLSYMLHSRFHTLYAYGGFVQTKEGLDFWLILSCSSRHPLVRNGRTSERMWNCFCIAQGERLVGRRNVLLLHCDAIEWTSLPPSFSEWGQFFMNWPHNQSHWLCGNVTKVPATWHSKNTERLLGCLSIKNVPAH